MLLTKRFGVTAESSSRRVHETALAGSRSTFVEMKTRPLLVAAHAVEVLAVVRSIAATAPPALEPHAPSVSGVGPRRSQSPQVSANVPNHSLQIAWACA